MDEKTEELRDIFMDVTDEDTVTEKQEDDRGSLTGDSENTDERLGEVVAEMRTVYEFTTDLNDKALVRIVHGFYEGESDAAVAEALDVSRSVIFRARMDLHLVRDRDTEAPFDIEDLREMVSDGRSVADIAAEFDVSESTVRRYRRVVEAQTESRQVSQRYRSEFEDAFTDAELSSNMTDDMKEDGLEDATEGMENDVSF